MVHTVDTQSTHIPNTTEEFNRGLVRPIVFMSKRQRVSLTVTNVISQDSEEIYGSAGSIPAWDFKPDSYRVTHYPEVRRRESEDNLQTSERLTESE